MTGKFYNNIKTVFLLGALTGLILWIGSFWGQAGVMIALILAAVMNFVSYFFSAQIALASMGAQEVGPGHPLHRIVAQLAQRANMPMPKVYVSPQPAPNAFATGRNPQNAAVCATEGLMQILDEREIAGVMAHELAHVKHRDVLIATVAATVAGAITSIAHMAMWFGMGHHNSDDEDGGGVNPIVGLLMMILAPIAAMLIQAAISRSREFNADTEGAAIAGDPMYLATALEKIHAAAHQIPLDVNPAYNSMFIAEPRNFMASVGNLFQTHPPLEKRLMNLIGQPTTGRFRYASAY